MEKPTTTAWHRNETARPRRSSLASLLTLTLWRLRQTWWLLALSSLALLLAFTLSCATPLFFALTTNAGLQDLLTALPSRSSLTLATTSTELSSSLVQQLNQHFEPPIRSNLGVYLDSQTSLVISIQLIQITAPNSLQKVNPLNLYATSIAHIKPDIHLLAGRWANDNMVNGEVEIMLPFATAQKLGLSIGETLTLQGGFRTQQSPPVVDPRNVLHARLVGTFATPDANAPALYGETFLPQPGDAGPVYTFLLSNTAFLQAIDAMATSEGSATVSTSPLISNVFALNWYYHLRTNKILLGQVDDLTTRLANAQYRINLLQLSAQFYNPAAAQADILSLLQQYASRVAVIRVPVLLLALQTVALLLFFASVLINLVIERQLKMSAILSSRGANGSQLLWSLTSQGVILWLLCGIAGTVLGLLTFFGLADTLLPPASAQSTLTLLGTSPGQLSSIVAPYLVVVALLALLAICLPFRRTGNTNVLDLQRETTRATHQPFWLRSYLDIIAALLALSCFASSLYLANAAQTLGVDTQELLIAPLTLVAPFFLLIGGLLLLLRFFPLFLQILAGAAVRRRGITAVVALAQIARAPRSLMRLTMLLTLASSFLFFTLTFVASQNQRALDIASYESGADFAGTLSPDWAALTPDKVSRQYSAIPGVLATSIGYIDEGRTLGLSANNIAVELRAVDTSSFARTANWDTQDSTQSLASLLSFLHQHEIRNPGALLVPAIVDEATLPTLHVKSGNTFDVDFSHLGDQRITFQIVEVVQRIPTVNSSSTAAASIGVLVDIEQLKRVYLNLQTNPYFQITAPKPLPINYIWLRTSGSPRTLAATRAALNTPDLALTNFYDRRLLSQELQNGPLTLTILLLLEVGGGTTLALALVSNLVASWLQVRQRLDSFVVLRALGLSRYRLAAILLWEQGILIVVAALLSLGFGLLLARLAVPALVFTDLPIHGNLSQLTAGQFYLLQRVLPPQVIIPPTSALIFVGLALAGLLTLVLLTRTIVRPPFTEALRLTDD